MHDLAAIVVAHDDAEWLPGCLTALRDHQGEVDAALVVVDSGSDDDGAELVRRSFPDVLVVEEANRGYGAACNAGARAVDARYLLFCNADTAPRDGTLAQLVRLLDARPRVGAAGVRQVDADGRLLPTIRRFPTAGRALGDALAVERLPLRPALLAERETDPAAHGAEQPCDWTTGSWLVVRREAFAAVGGFDERFFLFSEETDLCRRLADAGFETRHLPQLTVVHHERERRGSPLLERQAAESRRLYARAHLSAPHRAAYLGFVALRYLLRLHLPWARAALRTLLRLDPPPFAPAGSMPSGA